MTGSAARQGHRGQLYEAAIDAIARKYGITYAEAALAYNALGDKQRAERKEQQEKRQVEQRRRREGFPQYRPRDDFTGQVRR